MKKIILTILCVCSFLFDAHAQVYDITLTREGATAATYTAKNATLVTFSYNGDVPTVEFTSGQSAGSDAKYLEHTVRYNITFGKATSAINSGSGDPTTDDNGTVWAGAKPRKTASQDPQEPEISGPTLVIKTTGGYGTYTLSSENTTIKLKYDGTYYTVNSSGSDYTLSNVEAIYYVDPHQPVKHEAVAPTSTADGNIDYWTCSRCSKYFGDAACTEEVAKNSWVRTMVSGNITWDDSDDVDSKRPESVTITLLRGGELTDKSATVIASDNWAFSFTDLPSYDGESKITYSVSENAITDYTTAVDGYNVTNTHTHTHTFVPVMDGENPSFTWTKYSAAKLNLKCSNTKCTGTSSVDATSITSEVTTVPTTEAEGVQTYTAKATYNGKEYESTTTAPIDKLPAADKAISGDITPANNSVTVFNASNAVAEGTSAPTITVGTAAVPVTANIIITGSATDPTKAVVNVTVANGSILNIYGDGNSTVSGNFETTGGKVNITGGTINGTIKATSGAAVTLSNTNVTSTTGAAITAAQGATVTIGPGRYEGSERAVSITGDGVIKVADGRQAYGGLSSVGPFTVIGGSNLRQQSGAKARRTQAVDYAPAYKVLIVCDPVDSHSDDKFAGQKPFGSSELTGVYVCDKGCGTTKVVSTPTYTREMTNQWGTIVLPFGVTISESQNFDFYTVSSVSSTELQLTKITGTLAAGTPALIRMSEAAKNAETGKYTLSLTAPSNSVSSVITNPAAVNGLTLTGTYAVTEITDKSGYIISNNAFWNIANIKGENTVYNTPFRAYLDGTLSNGAKQLNIGISDDDDITAVEAIFSPLGESEGAIYDLNGRRLTDLQQGINIVKRGNKTYKIIVK